MRASFITCSRRPIESFESEYIYIDRIETACIVCAAEICDSRVKNCISDALNISRNLGTRVSTVTMRRTQN